LDRKLRRQIEEWRASLVAVDGRQRLVYFKHVKTASLEIGSPRLDALLAAVAGGSAVLTAQAPQGSEDDEGLESDGGRLPAELLKRPRLEVSNKTPKELPGALRRLDQVSQQTYADKGFWSLYVGAGFLRWLDPDDKPVDSPLLLVPVQLKREGDAGRWSLGPSDEDVVLNPALQLVMEQSYGITLPVPDADDVVVADYLATVRAAITRQPGWSVVERAVLTTFSFHKEAIFRDLLDHEQQVLEHPMVQLLALGPDSPTGDQFAFEPVPVDDVDQVLPPEQMMSILDADSSQRRCIIAARDGRSFVMDGPPGTGKSQTIANIVVELIASGRSVLFVSEKAAALDVVRNRLAEKKLSPFLLELHSHAATRKQVAAELHRALTQSPRAASRFSDIELSTLTRHRVELNDHAEAMNEVRKPLGRSLFNVLGRIARLEQYRQVAVPISPSWADLGDVTFAATLDRAARLGRAWQPVLQGEDFLWRDLRKATGGRLDTDAMERSARRAHESAAALRGLCDAVDEDLGMSFGRAAADVNRRQEVLALVEARPEGALEDWLSLDDTGFTALRDRKTELAAQIAEYVEINSRLQREAGPRHADLDSDLVADVDTLLQPGDLGWVPGGGVTATQAAALVDWLSGLPHRLVEINSMTQRLGGALGFGTQDPSLTVAARLADLAVLGETTARPLAPWFNPSIHAALQESERVLGSLVERMQSRRTALETVFTPAALELDLAVLDQRFREVHTGIRRWSGQARADRKLLRAATVSRKVTATELAHLGEAAEWQRAERALDRGEADYAGRLGAYYRRGETDFGRLSAAIDVVRQAIRLAGDELDMGALAHQLGADGDPDPLLTTYGARLRDEVAQLQDELQRHLAGHAPAVLSMSLLQLAEWSGRAAAAFAPGLTAARHVADTTGRDVTVRETRDLLRAARRRDASAAAIFETYESDVTELGPTYEGVETTWTRLDAALGWSADVRERLGGQVSPLVAGKVMEPSITSDELAVLVDRWSAARADVTAHFLDHRANELRETFAADLDGTVDFLEELTEGAATDIEIWSAYVELTGWFQEQGLSNTLAGLVEAAVPADDVAPAIERAVLMAWADATARGDDRLERYRAGDRDALVDDFRQLDRRQVEDRYATVVAQCAGRRPSSNSSRAAQVITREAAKKTRHKPIRQLLSETASLVQDLKPCFMMSPLSVSQFLPADMRFGVVIFDEASQVLPWDAVNCIYRGDSLIVAGDQKQLPPTNFFGSTGDESETDDDDSAPDSFESVLDLGKASGALRSLPLLWHYRSQHESLISYSNHRIYERELHTFPGATFEAPDLGVESFVVDGVYNRGTSRDNTVEAEFVVDRIVHHRTEHPELSIGVVTFSAAQEEAVLAAMERRAADEPLLHALLNDHDRLDGFFVKSLENVQGDERDVIVFTIGYGPDEFGKMTMNFGPLNKKGGWRRLNVAVTRARRRVEVVSSFRAGRITTDEFPKPDPDQSGLSHLKAYLDFAARGIAALAVDAKDDDAAPESVFEEDVLQVVRDMGYLVDPQVGSAGYRIDMAVRHPDREGEYVLGIECDGAAYHSAKAARDRDRLRQQVLEGLGWRMHRIWGLSWVRDRRGQTERLRAAIEEAMRGEVAPVRQIAPEPAPDLVFEEVDFDAAPAWAVAYSAHSAYGRTPQERPLAGPAMAEARPALRSYFERVIKTEAPVHQGRLMECFRKDWGVGRVGSAIQANVDLVLSKVTVDGRRVIRDGAGFLSLSGQHVTQVRVPTGEDGIRKVGWLPPAELDLAILLVVRDARSMTPSALSTAVCRLFGWRRLGADIETAVNAAVSRLLHDGALVAAGDELRLGTDVAASAGLRAVEAIGRKSVPHDLPVRRREDERSNGDVQDEREATASRARGTRARRRAELSKELEQAFEARIWEDIATVKRACGYQPAFFVSQVKSLGAVEAARNLLLNGEDRFNWKRLAKHSLLGSSPEAAALDPEFQALFSDREVSKAKARLRSLGYNPV
jgi:very-short-patch-repair endonuclease